MVSSKVMPFRTEMKEGETLGKPTEDNCEKFKGNNRHLNEEGYAKRGSVVKDGDILICKLSVAAPDEASKLIFSSTGRKKFTASTIVYDQPTPAVVHKIFKGVNAEGYPFIALTIIQTRRPEIGDKFAARHGQKGVVGVIAEQEDLPFNTRGITGDILINPLAFPSRMTVGMLIEIITGKTVLSTSVLHNFHVPDRHDTPFYEMFNMPGNPGVVDATPFRNFDMNVITEELAKYDCRYGEELFTDGTTGKTYMCMMFFGVAFYQRLRHMSGDKTNTRGRGSRAALTRQPKEGRAQGGGLRIGVMERDCILSHGQKSLLRDRLLEQSDKFITHVCQICGLTPRVGKNDTEKFCELCGVSRVAKITIPYGTKLVTQELAASNVFARVLIDDHTVLLAAATKSKK